MPTPRSSPLTPEFKFDPRLGKTGRYVNASTGRVVPAQAVNNAMEARITEARDTIRVVSDQLRQGQITLAQWQETMRANIKITHTMAGAIGKGGWAQMSQSDWGAVGNISRNQYRYLQNFALEIESGKQKLNGAFMRRADMYAQAARGTQARIQGREAARNGATEERRIRYAKDSCPTCLEEAGKGWQPLGTLRPIGDSECRTNCRCMFEYR